MTYKFYLNIFINIFFVSGGCENISAILTEWDVYLKTMLLNPQPNEGEKLLMSIDDYTCRLWEVRDEIRTTNFSIIENMKSIVSTRLPDFIRTYRKINKSNLYKVYNWTDREEKRLDYLILDSKHLWKTTVELHERVLKELTE